MTSALRAVTLPDPQPSTCVPAALSQARACCVAGPGDGQGVAGDELEEVLLEADRGGHFAAWEQPQLFSAEFRAAFRSLR